MSYERHTAFPSILLLEMQALPARPMRRIIADHGVPALSRCARRAAAAGLYSTAALGPTGRKRANPASASGAPLCAAARAMPWLKPDKKAMRQPNRSAFGDGRNA